MLVYDYACKSQGTQGIVRLSATTVCAEAMKVSSHHAAFQEQKPPCLQSCFQEAGWRAMHAALCKE